MLKRFLLLLLGCWVLFAPFAHAGNDQVGVVIVHGKWGSPGGYNLKFARTMEREGFQVISPEMTWSSRRSYDTGVEGSMKEIDAAVEALRKKGASKIIVAGHSLGAAAAIRYAGQRKVAGVIALAPGHFPDGKGFASMVARSVKKARDMVNAGATGTDWFDDPNSGGRMKPMRMTSMVYLEFFDPDGPMSFRKNAAAVLPGTPVLWVAGVAEETGLRRYGQVLYDTLPENVPHKFVEVPSGHVDTPDNAAAIAAAWINEVAAR